MYVKRLPRLLMQDMKDLRRAVAGLLAAHDTLKRSSWSSAPAVADLVMNAVMVMGPIYDRAEPVYLEILKEQGPRTLRERAAAELGIEQVAEDPEAAQEKPEDE
jgi:hypothetical protein